MKKEELKRMMFNYEMHLNFQIKRLSFLKTHLEPIEKEIPLVLKTYLNNDNEKRIEMDKLAPDAKTKILKYTFYMKAVSSVNTLISQIIDQLESTKKKS